MDFDGDQPNARATFTTTSQMTSAIEYEPALRQETNNEIQENDNSMNKSFSSISDIASELDEKPVEANATTTTMQKILEKGAENSNSATRVKSSTKNEIATPGRSEIRSERGIIAAITLDEKTIMTEAVQNEIEVVTSPSDKSYTSQEIREDAPDGQSDIENINEIHEEETENSRKTTIAREARGVPRQRKAARKSISRMHLVIQYEKQESRRRDAERKKQ